jgi:hypothetical protein
MQHCKQRSQAVGSCLHGRQQRQLHGLVVDERQRQLPQPPPGLLHIMTVLVLLQQGCTYIICCALCGHTPCKLAFPPLNLRWHALLEGALSRRAFGAWLSAQCRACTSPRAGCGWRCGSRRRTAPRRRPSSVASAPPRAGPPAPTRSSPWPPPRRCPPLHHWMRQPVNKVMHHRR